MVVPDGWVVDGNGDGYPDDVVVRLAVDLSAGDTRQGREFWAALLDLAASIGVSTHALPLPLVLTSPTDASVERSAIVVRGIDDIPHVQRGTPTTSAPRSNHEPASQCLSRFFTIDGALLDTDGDLLPDASRIAFDLPDTLPVPLGAALGNLAARIGLESGGATLPLARSDGSRFAVRPSKGQAVVRADDRGWLAEGDAHDLAHLIERIAATWPHITAPECGGVGGAVTSLRRWLTGDGPEPKQPGEIIQEWEWTDDWEVDRLLAAFRAWLRDHPASAGIPPAVAVTVSVSESSGQRALLENRLGAELLDHGYEVERVRVFRAFKQVLSWLEDAVIPSLLAWPHPIERVTIAYPRLEGENVLDLPIRWIQEAFPGTELLANALGIPLDRVEVTELSDPADTVVISAVDVTGTVACRYEERLQSVERPWVEAMPDAGTVTVTTGWLRIGTAEGSVIEIVPTDLEHFWDFWQGVVIPHLLSMIEEAGPLAGNQPFFSELVAEVWISEPNESLGIRQENVSAAEALAEDIYFTTLDAIELYGQRTSGEKLTAPGAVIPIIHVTPGDAPRATVTLRAAAPKPLLPLPELHVSAIRLAGDDLAVDITGIVEGDAAPTIARLNELAAMDLGGEATIDATIHVGEASIDLRLPLAGPMRSSLPIDEPPMDENIHGEVVTEWAERLANVSEVTAWIEDVSYQGRPIPALSLAAPTPGRLHSPMKAAILKPTHLIIARHHANEISSTNAAFRLAWLCATDPNWKRYLDRVNIVLLPYENPDGAALHVMLASDPDARTWKHHPARYNALGFEYGEDHFNPDSPFGEARARTSLWHRWPADAVVDNHGVPSHEWVQPFAGFGSPPRFRVSYWVVQALLYGIARYVDDPEYPEHQVAVERLRDAVSAKVRDTDIGEWNRVYGESYRFWGQSRLPDRFPGEFHDDMLWHISSGPAEPDGRGFSSRFPRTTVLNWVTEVADETATGEHLERVARAHLLANQATIDLLYNAARPVIPDIIEHGDGTHTVRVGRKRPLMLGS